jgi:uncharacterized protein (DUF983 family)
VTEPYAPLSAELRAALLRLERAIRADPRLNALVHLGRSCPSCRSIRIAALYSRGVGLCEACGHVWTILEKETP